MRRHDFIRDGEGWRTLKEEVHYANDHLSVATHTLLTPTRCDPAHPVRWTVVHRKAAVVVAPQTAAGEFILVRQERAPVRASLWEFPAGQVDDEGRSTDETVIRETAVREMGEEAGFGLAAPGDGGELIALGYFFCSPGFTDEHNYLFLARGAAPLEAGSSPDVHEAITECGRFSPAELRKMIAEGEIRDANTLAVFARLCARGLI